MRALDDEGTPDSVDFDPHDALLGCCPPLLLANLARRARLIPGVLGRFVSLRNLETSKRSIFSGELRPATLAILATTALVSYNNLSVSAASPEIGADLGSVGLLPWVITAELLATAVAVLAMGPIVDSSGVRVVFRAAMITFIMSSLACALATSMPMLIGFRIGQGIGAGGVIGSTVAAVGLGYDPDVRPRMYAAISGVWGVMGVGGPAIAAILISLAGWRSIFTVTIPIGLAATAIGWRRLPGKRGGGAAAAFDLRGFVVMGALTICLLVAASTTSRWAFVWLLGVAVLGFLYVRLSQLIENPVLRLEHIVGRRWRHVHLTAFLGIAGGTGAGAYLPLYLRAARGASAAGAAFSVLFLTFGWTAGAFAASRLQERMDAAYVVRLGARLLASTMVLSIAAIWFELPLPVLFMSTAIAGFGIGMLSTSGLAILQGRARSAEMGRVSGAHQFIRSLAWTYGAAVGGLVIFGVVGSRIGDIEAVRDLLSSDELLVDDETIDAVQIGYATAATATGLFTAGCLASARQLVKNIGVFE